MIPGRSMLVEPGHATRKPGARSWSYQSDIHSTGHTGVQVSALVQGRALPCKASSRNTPERMNGTSQWRPIHGPVPAQDTATSPKQPTFAIDPSVHSLLPPFVAPPQKAHKRRLTKVTKAMGDPELLTLSRAAATGPEVRASVATHHGLVGVGPLILSPALPPRRPSPALRFLENGCS